MAATMLSVIISLVVLFVFLSPITASLSTKPNGYQIKLIHIDSVNSPLYNPGQSLQDRAQKNLDRSIARHAMLSRRISGTSDDDLRLRVENNEDVGIFLVKFYIGNPVIEQVAMMDTGSSLLWLDSRECQSCHEKEYTYNRRSSSTYANVDCESCDYDCFVDDDEEVCYFREEYGDGLGVAGDIGTETLFFVTADGYIQSFPEKVFGVVLEKKNESEPHKKFNGIFGLGIEKKSSFIKSFGSSFSYCVGDVRNATSDNHILWIGNNSIMYGASTPFAYAMGVYHIALQAISIGDFPLPIHPYAFKLNPQTGTGGTIIDSGSNNCELPRVAYDAVGREMYRLLSKTPPPEIPEPLCFEGDLKNSTIPPFTFHFADNANLEVQGVYMFEETIPGEKFCLGIYPSTAYDRSVIAINAQQFTNVGYDIQNRRIHFFSAPDGCEELLAQ